MANKVHFGLKNCYYATVTEATLGGVTTTTYGTPVALPGAVSLTLDANQEHTDFYADDGVYYITQNDARYTGTLELADIPDAFKTAIFGDAADQDGALIEMSANDIKNFALLFETSGDAGGHRAVFYKVSATRPSITGQTKEENVEVQTQTLNITAVARPDNDTVNGKTRHLVQASIAESAVAAYTGFFNAVYTPNF